MTFSYLLLQNVCCGYSLELPPWGNSNEYPQHVFSCWNKDLFILFLVEKGVLSLVPGAAAEVGMCITDFTHMLARSPVIENTFGGADGGVVSKVMTGEEQTEKKKSEKKKK